MDTETLSQEEHTRDRGDDVSREGVRGTWEQTVPLEFEDLGRLQLQ